MEHLVTFQTAEGREGNHTAASLDEALRFVERLRNNEDASDVRVFRMQEVPIEFKAYFKVEIGEAKAEEPPAEESTDATAPESAPPPAPALVGSVGGEEGVEGSRRLFHRG